MPKEKFKVVGAVAVGGVAPGGEAELDPGEVNVPALLEAGLVEPVKVRKPEPKPEGKAG